MKGLPLANIAFSPTYLNTSSGVHSADFEKKTKYTESSIHIQIYHSKVLSNDKNRHKPLVVGFDMGNIAGRGQSDSLIALSTCQENIKLKAGISFSFYQVH